MCTRYGKCVKYSKTTPYLLVACLVMLAASLAFFLNIGAVVFSVGLTHDSLIGLWGLLLGATLTGGLGVSLAFVVVSRLH